ncbi:MAG: hypothetical protein OXC14_18430 [Rhodospirillaceae bacterium]|nr:hypothetical protein [Rhodospirillaceae bacterium]
MEQQAIFPGFEEEQIELPGMGVFTVADNGEVRLGGQGVGWTKAVPMGMNIGLSFEYGGKVFKSLSRAGLERCLNDWRWR